MSEPGHEDFVNQRGCLTAQGLAAVVRAPVGKAPTELAVHLASCPRCQERLLASGREGGKTTRQAEPKTWRNLLLVLAAMLAGLLILGMTLGRLRS